MNKEWLNNLDIKKLLKINWNIIVIYKINFIKNSHKFIKYYLKKILKNNSYNGIML